MKRRRNPDDLTDAERARASALLNLAHAESRGPEVTRLARSLKELRERNHFAAQIERLIQGRLT